MEQIKVAVGIVIIILSFVYILRNKTSMLDNLLAKSKKEYEQRQAIKEKAHEVIDGQADAFDTLADGVKQVTKPLKDEIDQKKHLYR